MVRYLHLTALAGIALFLWASPALAAVAFDAKGTTDCSATGTSASCSTLTIGSGSNRALVALVALNSGTDPTTGATATWNGTAMTKAGCSLTTANGTGTCLFCLPNPASGAQALVISTTVTSEIHVIGASYTGANQSTPCKNFTGTNSSGSVGATVSTSVTSATGDIVVAVQGQGDDSVSSVSGTQIIIDNGGPTISFSGNYASGATTVALTATAGASVTWTASGLDIAAAGAAAGCTSRALLLGAGC